MSTPGGEPKPKNQLTTGQKLVAVAFISALAGNVDLTKMPDAAQQLGQAFQNVIPAVQFQEN